MTLHACMQNKALAQLIRFRGGGGGGGRGEWGGGGCRRVPGKIEQKKVLFFCRWTHRHIQTRMEIEKEEERLPSSPREAHHFHRPLRTEPNGRVRPLAAACRRVAVSPCRRVAVSPCRRVAVSPCRRVAVSPCRRVAVSPCRRVVVYGCLSATLAIFQI